MPCRVCGQSLKNHLDNCPAAKKGTVDRRPLTVTETVLATREEETVRAKRAEGYFLQERRDDGNHVVLRFMLSA